MPRATDDNITTAGRAPAPLATHYIPSNPPLPTTITRPGKTRRSPVTVIQGKILGTMYLGTEVHHYRVSATDGVLYFAPPEWLPPDPLLACDRAFNAYLAQAMADIKCRWAMRRLHAPQPETVA